MTRTCCPRRPQRWLAVADSRRTLDLLRRLDRWSEAAASYRRALALATNATEHRFLEGRLAEVEGAGERRPD